MAAIHGIDNHRLTRWLVLAGLLAGGMAGYWFGIHHGPVTADAFAGEKGAKEPAAQGGKAIPVVTIVTRYPGMSPQSMESEITDRLERALRHAEGLRAIESKSTTGLSIVQLHFDESIAPPIALAQAAGLAATVAPHFPPGTPASEVSVVDRARILPACVLVIDDANMSLEHRADAARQYILPELASTAGIAARLRPAPERVIAVTLNPERLQAFNVTVQAVRAALQEADTPPQAGMVRVGDRQLLLNSPVLSLGDLKNLPVRTAERIYLRDLAKIAESSDVPAALTHVNGRRQFWVAIHAKRGVSDAAGKDAVRNALAKMQARLPKGAKLDMLTFGDEVNTEAGVVTLHVHAAAGTRLEVCDTLVTKVEQYLKTIIPAADVRFMLAYVGPDTSASAAWPLRAGPHQATIRVQLTEPAGARGLVKKLRLLLRERFPDLHASCHAGPGTTWPVVVHVGGGTPAQAEKLAGQVADRIAKLREAADVEVCERLPCLRVDMDLEKAALVGVARADVQRAMLTVGGGLHCRVQVAQAGGDPRATLRVTLRLPKLEVKSLRELSNIPINNSADPPIALRNLATLKIADAPAEIEHRDGTRVIAIRVNTDEVDKGPLVKVIENSLKDLPVPEGMWHKVQTAP